MNNWPTIQLSEVLQLQRRWLKPEPMRTYREIGVRSFGKGIFHKVPVEGSVLGNKRVLRIEPGDLVFNNVFAWEGAVAIAGTTEAGMIGSHRFVTYRVNPSQATAEFLKLFFTTPRGLELLLKASPGSAGRNKTLGLDRFISQSIPLPPLAEQRRVVAWIEELAAQIHEARTLRHQAAEEAEGLIHAFTSKLAYHKQWEMKRLSAVAEINPPRAGRVKLDQSDKVSFVPMRAVDDVTGRIAWPETKEFHEVAKGYTWFQDGDVIFARITPCMQNGKAALARHLVNGVGFGSTEFHVIRAGSEVCAEWIYHLVRHKAFRDDAAEHFKGTAGQLRVPQSFLQEKLIPVPQLHEQRRIVAELDALQAEVETLRRFQAETAAELDALLPSVLNKVFEGEL